MAGQEVAQRTPMQQVLAEVTAPNFIARIKHALPEKVTPERFVSVTTTAIRQNPELITADRDSLFTSVVRCAQDGLLPDGREAALVIFKGKVQYLPMIGGLRKRLAEYGFDLISYVVHDHDTFDYELGAKPWVKHKPPKLGEPRGEVIGAYAVATDARGRKYLEVMARDEIEKVRAVSRASQRGPWVDWYEEQCRKTVARRLTKALPVSDQDGKVAQMLEAIDAEYELTPPEEPMSEPQANAIAASSTSSVPVGERQQLRDEPGPERPTDAQLNRIAQLQDEAGEQQARAFLRGVFGVKTPEELSPEEADRYEQTLRSFLAEQNAPAEEAVVEGELVDDGSGQSSFADRVPEDVKKRQRKGSSQ